MQRATNVVAFQLLGQFGLVLADKPSRTLTITAPRHRALLGYLALHKEGVGRDQIAELLWGDRLDRQARQSLRQAILSIRKDLKSAHVDLLETERDFVRLKLQNVRVDVQEFLRHANSSSPFGLSLAADIYKGDFFGSFFLGLDAFDSWLAATRDQLRLKATELFESQISYLNSEGRHADALIAAERLVRLDAANEASQRLLIHQIATHRGRIAAVEYAVSFSEHLKSHYGAKPEAETLQLIASLRATSSARSTDGYEYYAPETSHKVLVSRTAREGERKLITVLLASMNMRMGSDPEEEWRRLDPLLKHLSEAVRAYGGVVNQVTHNGIMALFGAPEAREDHAVSACFSALRMFEGNTALEEEAPQIRVAINSGEVIIRMIASDLQVDYSAVGETTQYAKMLEQVTPVGSIVISRSTADLASGFIKARPFTAPFALLPDEAYELRGGVVNGSRLLGASARGLTPFVGRSAEMGWLRGSLQQARLGHGQIVACVGEPGIGKSRVCIEFVTSAAAMDCLVLQGNAEPFGPARSLFPFLEMLRAFFRIHDNDNVSAMRAKVRSGVAALGDTIDSLAPSLLSLLDIPVDDKTWQDSSPARRRRQTLEALVRFLSELSRKQCLIIVIENLHWIDDESILLLDKLIPEAARRRIVFLLTYRPEFKNRWLSFHHSRELRLEPFDKTSTRKLVTRLLGHHPSMASLTEKLLERTDGNPLFLEESVHLLIETGVLGGEHEAFSLNRAVTAVRLPATVQGLLAARIDRLSESDKRLLQTAAVVGRRVKIPLLADVADATPTELQERLKVLEAGDFLRRLPTPEATYIFKHGFTHDVTYRGILQNRRRDLHARIAWAMQALYVERIDEHAEQLGYHALKGELWEQAVESLRRAGLNAAGRSQNRDAQRLFEAALSALERLPNSRKNSELSIDVRLELRNALLSLADQQGAERVCIEARELAANLEDSTRLGRAMASLSTLCMTKGDLKNGAAFGAQAVAQGDIASKALGLPAMALNIQSMGRHTEAISQFRETIAFASGPLLYERFGQLLAPSVFGHAGLAIGLAETGYFEEAVEVGKRGVEIAESRQLPAGNLGYALAGLGRAFLRRGDIDEAETALKRGVDTCRNFEIPYYEVVLTPSLASAHVQAGKSELAIELLERVRQIGERMNMGNMRPLILGALSEATFAIGDLDRANALALEAIEITRAQHQRGFEAGLLKLLAKIANRRSEDALAERLYNESLRAAAECGMRPLVAHCHLGLGELYRKLNRPSRSHLRLAADLYQEMQMTKWLKKVQMSPDQRSRTRG